MFVYKGSVRQYAIYFTIPLNLISRPAIYAPWFSTEAEKHSEGKGCKDIWETILQQQQLEVMHLTRRNPAVCRNILLLCPRFLDKYIVVLCHWYSLFTMMSEIIRARLT